MKKWGKLSQEQRRIREKNWDATSSSSEEWKMIIKRSRKLPQKEIFCLVIYIHIYIAIGGTPNQELQVFQVYTSD